MIKEEKLKKYISEAQNFLGHNLTSSDSKFEAWNHSLLRFIKDNYDNETYKIFKDRIYSLGCCAIGIPKSDFVEAFERDIRTTIEDLKMLLEEENDGDNIETYAKTNETKDESTQIIINIFNRFHKICKQLRNRYDSRETLDVCDEYDVQDLMHALLLLNFDDIRPEEWTPSYAGGASRQDFLLKKEQIVIEIKKTRKGLQDKQLGEQLIVDIAKYKKHPDCKKLFCFVYDPEEKIINPVGIENDLIGEHDNLYVIVKIVQK